VSEDNLKHFQGGSALIGVIGGVGPYAGLDFVRKIFSNTRAVKDQDHLNCVLVSCPSIIPDRTAFLLQGGEGENPAYGMFESARLLHKAGVLYASVACNTAHSSRIFSPFCAMVKESLPGLQIVNMLETCAEYVKKSFHKEIINLGLLATIGTHKSRLYHEYFREEDNIRLIEPDGRDQEIIHQAIYSEEFGIKAHSMNVTPQAQDCVRREIYKLIDQGAEAIILGCTELPLAVPEACVQGDNFPAPIIDPAAVTARRLIELTAPEKLTELMT
jgi:aspartate racemase